MQLNPKKIFYGNIIFLSYLRLGKVKQRNLTRLDDPLQGLENNIHTDIIRKGGAVGVQWLEIKKVKTSVKFISLTPENIIYFVFSFEEEGVVD